MYKFKLYEHLSLESSAVVDKSMDFRHTLNHDGLIELKNIINHHKTSDYQFRKFLVTNYILKLDGRFWDSQFWDEEVKTINSTFAKVKILVSLFWQFLIFKSYQVQLFNYQTNYLLAVSKIFLSIISSQKVTLLLLGISSSVLMYSLGIFTVGKLLLVLMLTALSFVIHELSHYLVLQHSRLSLQLRTSWGKCQILYNSKISTNLQILSSIFGPLATGIVIPLGMVIGYFMNIEIQFCLIIGHMIFGLHLISLLPYFDDGQKVTYYIKHGLQKRKNRCI